jgi:hypothetical protein
LLARPLIPAYLASAETGLVGEIGKRLLGERSRLRVAVGRVVLPREEDDSPVIGLFLILGRFQRRFYDVPKVSSAPSAPRSLHNDGPVFRARECAGEDLFAASQVFGLHISPLADPEKRVRAAASVRAREKSACLRSLVFMEAHAKLAGVGAVHNESRLEFAVERVICKGDDVAELLACVLLRAIDEGELLARRPAKLVGADDA